MNEISNVETLLRELLLHHYARADQAADGFRGLLLAMGTLGIGFALESAADKGSNAASVHLSASLLFAACVVIVAGSWLLQKDKALRRRNALRAAYADLPVLPTVDKVNAALACYVKLDSGVERSGWRRNETWDVVALAMFGVGLGLEFLVAAIQVIG